MLICRARLRNRVLDSWSRGRGCDSRHSNPLCASVTMQCNLVLGWD